MNDKSSTDRDCSHQDLLRGVYDMGFTKPSKIQERALPLLIANPYVGHLFSVNSRRSFVVLVHKI